MARFVVLDVEHDNAVLGDVTLVGVELSSTIRFRVKADVPGNSPVALLIAGDVMPGETRGDREVEIVISP